MNRRQFFKALGSSAGAITLSAGGIALLEQEIWQPTKAIFLPPKGGWVASNLEVWSIQEFRNRFINPAVIALAQKVDSEMVEWARGPTKEAAFQEFYKMLNRPKRYVLVGSK